VVSKQSLRAPLPFFLPLAMLGLLGLPIFFSIPPQLGAFSLANKLLIMDKCGQLFNKTFSFFKESFFLGL